MEKDYPETRSHIKLVTALGSPGDHASLNALTLKMLVNK